MKSISLLGSTGSIGVNVLDVVRRCPDRYRIVALAAGTNISLLARQVIEFDPEIISIAEEKYSTQLRELLPRQYHARICFGVEGAKLAAACRSADITFSAIVGSAGLQPTLAAIEAGKDIGLANKETLVMAGRIVIDAATKNGVRLFPVDSEHSAIFQALEAGRKEDLSKIILTASGGPFHGKSRRQLEEVTPEQALMHPNWSMGRKISIDSATLMNKGLEVIEARWLFDVLAGTIEVVVHPQSIVHSLVEYVDGSVLAQLGIPDMRIPIAYALSYPERMDLGLNPLRLSQCGRLEFIEPDYQCFPALKLAFDALEQGGVLPAVLNGANEVAVDAFLASRISFLQIAETVARTMDIVNEGREDCLEDILLADSRARREAEAVIRILS
ncbi:1-deoxy-D-xylulose-5-phosphate reductoisomerase [Desulforhopalus singaporensis]|uniref:1-deoxy-D-xylulose 5-phosphate reductoisomerase n=1 Tax=Desulforhopalus singaporensis TaxID=91360 RepID=A0A1H0RE25_9BACT|nr:1-deoxy-D-xylulose-5-phosphate reductoisomerase [Desulforhopalus singaporensis]SDP27429.1 1-deoxy-D-xylulose 5-phosphate reductoisomerase [Desulforhopalus singaporensis]